MSNKQNGAIRQSYQNTIGNHKFSSGKDLFLPSFHHHHHHLTNKKKGKKLVTLTSTPSLSLTTNLISTEMQCITIHRNLSPQVALVENWEKQKNWGLAGCQGLTTMMIVSPLSRVVPAFTMAYKWGLLTRICLDVPGS